MSPPGTNPSSPPAKLVKKKLVRSSKRVQRVVNLDSDHDQSGDEDGHLHDDHEVLGAPVVLEKKKKKTIKKKAVDGEAAGEEGGEKKTKKKVVKKKKSQGLVSFAGDQSNGLQGMTAINGQDNHNGNEDDGIDHSECKGNNHVHRLAQLEQSMANNRISQPSRGILKKSPSVVSHRHHDTSSSPPDHSYLRPTSPTGSYSSMSDDGSAEAYRRKIEAMRNEAGSNWLKVLAEMDSETALRKDSEANTNNSNSHHQ